MQKTLNKLDISLKSVTKANNDLEQYTRRECVEISGIPQKPDESTNTIVKQLGKAVGVEIADIDISVSHRLPPSKLYKSRKPGRRLLLSSLSGMTQKMHFIRQE